MKIDWKEILEGWLFISPLLIVTAIVIAWGIWSDSQRIEALKEIATKCEKTEAQK